MTIQVFPEPAPADVTFSIGQVQIGDSSNTNSVANNNQANAATFYADNLSIPTGSYVVYGLGTDSSLVSTLKSTYTVVNNQELSPISPVLTLTTTATSIKFNVPAQWEGIADNTGIFTSRTYYGVGYGNETWVTTLADAVTQWAYSTNEGNTWTTITTTAGRPLFTSTTSFVDYVNGIFYAGNDGNAIFFSTDGTSWTNTGITYSTTTFSASGTNGVAYGNDAYVTVMNRPPNGVGQSYVWWSSNGTTTWTTRATPFGTSGAVANAGAGVVFGAGKFVAGSEQSILFISSDGITWTTGTTGGAGTSATSKLIWTGTKFYASRNGGTNATEIRSSTDAITWTIETTTAPEVDQVQGPGTLFWSTYMPGFLMLSDDDNIYTSSDAITWVRKDRAPTQQNYRMAAFSASSAMIAGQASFATNPNNGLAKSGPDCCGYVTVNAGLILERKGAVTQAV